MLDRLKATEHAMVTRMNQLEVVTNNLANIDTTGFKRDELFMNELDRKVKELAFSKFERDTHIPYSGASVNLTQGALASTEQPLDVAISGDGFFTFETPAGEALSRDGRFTVNQEGILVTLDGYVVLGDGGPIELDLQQNKPSDLVINDQGEVMLNDAVVGRLQIVTVDAPQNLRKLGSNLFQLPDGQGNIAPAENVSLRQGFLEESNVDAVDEMVTMMEIFHFYQTGQRMIQEQDRILGKAVNEIGRVS